MSDAKPAKTFRWDDPLDLEGRLTDDERMSRDAARSYARDALLPRVVAAFRDETFDRAIMTELGEMGFLGAMLPEQYGGSEASHVAYGLIAREIEAVDSGYRSAMSVQSSLAMYPIYAFGSDEQKAKYLPKMAAGELIGCFGLTEADGGSDPASMKTKAVAVDGGYRLNGAKYWITNSPISDLAVVWAKLDDVIRGFIVERDFDGFTTDKIGDKLSLRASVTGDIGLNDVFVPEANILPGVKGLRGPFSCLNKARYGIAWGAMGAAEFCFHASREYVGDTFAHPERQTRAVPDPDPCARFGPRFRPEGVAARFITGLYTPELSGAHAEESPNADPRSNSEAPSGDR